MWRLSFAPIILAQYAWSSLAINSCQHGHWPNITIVECTDQGGKSDSIQNAEDETLPNAAGEGGEEELPAQTCFWNFKEW